MFNSSSQFAAGLNETRVFSGISTTPSSGLRWDKSLEVALEILKYETCH